MRWDLEELVEDSFVGYLRGQVSGNMKVAAAFDFDAPQFPMCVILAESTEPISEPAAWHDARKMIVSVAIMTENASEVDAAGNEITSPRERNRAARSDVLNALCIDTLADSLNAAGVQGIAFSGALVVATARAAEGQAMSTTATIECYVEPVTGSGE